MRYSVPPSRLSLTEPAGWMCPLWQLLMSPGGTSAYLRVLSNKRREKGTGPCSRWWGSSHWARLVTASMRDADLGNPLVHGEVEKPHEVPPVVVLGHPPIPAIVQPSLNHGRGDLVDRSAPVTSAEAAHPGSDVNEGAFPAVRLALALLVDPIQPVLTPHERPGTRRWPPRPPPSSSRTSGSACRRKSRNPLARIFPGAVPWPG